MLIDAPLVLAVRALEVLFGLSLAIQTLEFLRMGAATSNTDLWSWSLQRADIPHASLRRLLDVVFAPDMHRLNLCLRLVAAVWLAVYAALWSWCLACL